MQANKTNQRIAEQIIEIISHDYQNFPFINQIQA